MAAAIALGGFTGPEADTLGYAIRKKKSSVLRAQKEKFVSQAAERGVEPKVIDAVFKAFEPFERYGFNKAHATCYGLIAYQTAYLKANYTVEYMTSVLTAFRDNAEKVAAAIAECRRLGIEVRPPDVHRSHLGFTVEGDAIRFGLLAVKNVGEGAIESIIEAREERRRVPVADRLLHAGRPAARQPQGARVADPGRGAQRVRAPGADPARARRRARRRPGRAARPDHRPDVAVRHGRRRRGGRSSGRSRRRPRRRSASGCAGRRSCSGLYLSDHPMGEVAERVGPVRDGLLAATSRTRRSTGSGSSSAGSSPGSRTVITKSKSTMAVVTLEDLQGTLEVVVFPRTYEQTLGHVARGRDPARRRPGRPPGRGGVAARRLRVGLGHGRRPRAGGVRPRGRVAGPAGRRAPAAARAARATGRRTATVGGRRDAGGGRRRASGPAVRCGARRRRSPLRVSPTRAGRRRPAADRARPEPDPDVRGAAGPRVSLARRRRWPSRRGAAAPRRGSAPSPRRPRRPRREPVEASPGAVLNVRFARDAGSERVVSRDAGVQGACSASGRARPGSSSTSRRPAAPRCRWSCGASPTTPSCWPRCAAGSATG